MLKHWIKDKMNKLHMFHAFVKKKPPEKKSLDEMCLFSSADLFFSFFLFTLNTGN